MRERRATFLPLSRPALESDEIEEVVDSLRSGWLTTGPKVERFESLFRERLGVEHAVAVNSATAGLHLAVAVLDLAPGDEVIVPSITWASTANVIELCGAVAVFADVDPQTLCIDPESAASRVTERTRAIVPVHYAGQPVDLTAIRELAQRRNLELIHDAAHALGTVHDEEEIGASGEVTVFSFHPIKNITTGEGGMIVLNDSARAESFRLLRFHGVSVDAWKRRGGGGPEYDVLRPGWKYNMLDIQAALGIHQLGRLDRFNAVRRRRAERYDRLLEQIPEITPLGRVPYPATHAWHLYVVRLDTDAVALDRNGLLEALRSENIGTGIHFPPLHLSSYYRKKYGYRPGSLPHAEDAGRRIFSLPLHPLLSEEDQDDVVTALKRVISLHRRRS